MASLKEYQSMNAPPSVSNEQWKKYALKKMTSGYLLIISNTRSIARFYKGNGALENCSYRMAKRLLQLGFLEEVGTHLTGTMYQLSDAQRDQEALTKLRQSQMGVLQILDEEADDEDDDMGFDMDIALSEETTETEGEDSDVNPAAT